MDGKTKVEVRLTEHELGYLRREGPTSPMHATGVLELPAVPGAAPLTVEQVRAAVAERLPWLPILKSRLHPPPLGLGRHRWVTDPDFDLSRHVSLVEANVSSIGDVADLAAELAMTLLDRRAPLWRLYVTRALPDGRQFLLLLLHHSFTDGVYGSEIVTRLLGAAAPPGEPPRTVFAPPGAVRTVLEGVRSLFGRLRDAGQALRHARTGTGLGGPRPDEPPATSLSGPLGTRRVVEFRDVPTADIRDAQDRHGVTSNDVYLAMVAGGMRQLLSSRGSLVPVVAMVPRNARTSDERQNVGSSTWAMYVDLHVEEPDDRRRLAGIAAGTAEGKALRGSQGARGYGWDVVVTSGLVAPTARAVAGRPIANARAVAPLTGHNRLAVVRTRTSDQTQITFTGDGDAFPDLAVLADGTLDGLARLLAAKV